MSEIVVIDDDEVVVSRVQRWLADHPSLRLRLNEGLSLPVRPNGWEGIKDKIGSMAGRFLIFLDMRLRFDGATRRKIRYEYPEFPPALGEEIRDGFAVANLLMANRDIEGSVVIVNSTLGVGDELLEALENASQALQGKVGVRFVPTLGALSKSFQVACNILQMGAQEFKGMGRINTEESEPVLTREELGERLKSVVESHRLFNTSFFLQLSTPGGIELEHLQRFGVLYYPHVIRTRCYQASALGICPDEGVQAALAQILYDEYGLGDATRSHPELYRRFLRGIGVPEDEWNAEPEIGELDLYIRALTSVSTRTPWQFAVGAVGLGGELPIPQLYEGIIGGVRSIPGVSERDLEIFRLHIEVDKDHGRLLLDSTVEASRTRAEQRYVEDGLRFSLDSRALVLEALGRVILGPQLSRDS